MFFNKNKTSTFKRASTAIGIKKQKEAIKQYYINKKKTKTLTTNTKKR